MTRSTRSDFPGLRHVILLIPWMVVGLAARAPIRDNSFLWHVRAGTLQVDRGEVLLADPFSFNSPDVVWRTQSWLADIGYGWLERLVGLEFVWPLILTIGTLLLVGIGLVFRQQSKSLFWTALILTASAILLAPYMNPRPALFSLLLFVLVVMSAQESRLWWSLPLITWAWASLHGGWPLGVLFVVLWAIYRSDWRLGQQIVPMATAALFSAHGWGSLEILIDFVRARDALALITEWAPTNLASLTGFIFLLGLAVALIGRSTSSRPTYRALWLVVPFLYLAVSSTRSLPFGWLALIPLLTSVAAGLRDPEILHNETPGRRIVNCAIGIALVGLPFTIATAPQLDPSRFPIEASARLESEKVFHDDIVGGYLIFAHASERKVFIDDRAELYGSRIESFMRTRNALPGWQETFAQAGIGEALVRAEDPIGEALRREGWVVAYSDPEFVVLRSPQLAK